MNKHLEELIIGILTCIMLSLFVGLVVYCCYELSQQIIHIQAGYYYG
jgi:hypothetical protein